MDWFDLVLRIVVIMFSAAFLVFCLIVGYFVITEIIEERRRKEDVHPVSRRSTK